MSEFNLSDKQKHDEFHGEDFFSPEDVKEFIRLLKKDCDLYLKAKDIKISIDKLAGEKLI